YILYSQSLKKNPLLSFHLNLGARELGIDQFEIRERNIMDDVNFYKLPTGIVYDSGKYREMLRIAKPYYHELLRRRNELRSKGKLAGVGIAIVSEIASFGPFSTAKVKVLPNGRIQVVTGTTPHGQGDATAFAQIASEIFEVDPSQVDVLWGDTDLIAEGDLTAGSRSVTVGGSAVF
ncbi:xanthine dehydrogenase family protein molybdopterin-binding subunit, partial [Sulfolobus sp. A20-N-F6]